MMIGAQDQDRDAHLDAGKLCICGCNHHNSEDLAAKNFRDCSDVYTFENLEFNSTYSSSHAIAHEILDLGNPLSTRSSNPFMEDNVCESSRVNSRSGTSTESQSAVNPNGLMSFGGCLNQHQSWAENSPKCNASPSIDEIKDERRQNNNGGDFFFATRSSDHYQPKITDTKVLRRLAQNREAARKSRLRKKAYVQQLESSWVKLNQLEEELERVTQQGPYFGRHSVAIGDVRRALNPGITAFNLEYGRWIEEQNRQLSELQSALTTRVSDDELCVLVENGIALYDELFHYKAAAVKADVFHIVSGMWKTPAERCFMWMGGFRPSELLKILIPQLEPLIEPQMLAVCNLQQSSQQAEDALSQGMEALQQDLADKLAAGSLGNAANYMDQMAMALIKLGTLESFVRQADNLRHRTLQQMHRVLTTQQAARGLLAMGDYFSRLRALSSLWIARPRH